MQGSGDTEEKEIKWYKSQNKGKWVNGIMASHWLWLPAIGLCEIGTVISQSIVDQVAADTAIALPAELSATDGFWWRGSHYLIKLQ